MESSVINRQDASDMLQDALQQFDSIIEGSTMDDNHYVDDFEAGFKGISQLLDDMKMTIEAEQITSGNGIERLLTHLSPGTLQFYQKLFKVENLKPENESEKMTRLVNENRSLTLQVSVLTDQVDLQTENLKDAENSTKLQREKLKSAERSLQEEISVRTKHENESLELMKQLSSLKVQLVEYELQEKQRIIKEEKQKEEDCSHQAVSKTDVSVQVNISFTPDFPDSKLKDFPKELDIRNVQHIAKISSPGHLAGMVDSPGTPRQVLEPCSTSTPINHDNSIKGRSRSFEKLHDSRIMPTSDSINERLAASPQIKSPSSPQSNQKSPKSSSTPNLAATEEAKPEEPRELEIQPGIQADQQSNFSNRKKHGFKKFFKSFRLRRSHSTTLQDTDEATWHSKLAGKGSGVAADNPFQRSGFRATVGPRIGGWSRENKSERDERRNSEQPFSQWKTEQVCDWLMSIGLVSYVPNCKNWVKSGATLLQATNNDLEKNLGIHHPLHRKKLLLSLQAIGEDEDGEVSGAGMDHVWVAKWLDDIGLPQYKDVFEEACIDGRMLHNLTISDLQRLRITNLLHTLSLRHGIYTLRKLNFDPKKLRRRPSESENEEISLWTNHRVMEWLRSIDLAEYAPNLRGSGVHGSLMVLEPHFTGETLASLLHIQNSKSLLRRHLTTKFQNLILDENVRLKRHQPHSSHSLSITAKVKIGRRTFAPLRSFRSSNAAGSSGYEFSSGEYVCPVEVKNSTKPRSFLEHRRALEAKLKNSDELDQDDENGTLQPGNLDEKTTKEIGAVSAELATLTQKWSEDD